MNKKLNHLAVIPLYGSIIMLFWVFVKAIKHEINIKRFYKFFIACGLFGGSAILILMLFLLFISALVDIKNYIGYGVLTVVILGGYLMNLFTFTLLNKRWDDLY